MEAFLQVFFFVLVAVFVLGLFITTWATYKSTDYSEPEAWQKWVFFAWTVAGPLYLYLAWECYGSVLTDDSMIKAFQYRQKLLGDLWTASAVIFGVFWGLKKI